MSFLRMISSPENYERDRAYYEEMAFQRKASQGELCTPSVISDGQPALQSQTNGRIYDSKSEMRKEYKRAGVEEVGTSKQQNGRTWAEERAYRAKHKEKCKAALYKAHSQMGHGAP